MGLCSRARTRHDRIYSKKISKNLIISSIRRRR
jgi:hypothetical protein